MFWKRKANRLIRKDKDDDSEMFSFESRERRKWFRVHPTPEEPVFVRMGGNQLEVRDIGAAGLAFKNENIPEGEKIAFSLSLPGLGPAISIVAMVVSNDENGFCHCKFQAIEPKAVEQIHQYVLKRQKEMIQAKRKKEKTKSVVLRLDRQ